MTHFYFKMTAINYLSYTSDWSVFEPKPSVFCRKPV